MNSQFSANYKSRLKSGILLIGLSVFLCLLKRALVASGSVHDSPWLTFAISLIAIIGAILLIPFEWIPLIFFDNHDYQPNKSIEELIQKIRFRAVLFNNIAILVFVIAIFVIIAGFYLLSGTDVSAANTSFFSNNLVVKIGSVTLLIFLVGILFRAFKYLLRVAAFYNGRADGIEISKLKEGTDMKEMMTILSPDSFDISDLPESSMLQSLSGFIKGKS